MLLGGIEASGIKWVKEIATLEIYFHMFLNPLSANLTKWSNTRKQFVGNSRQIV